MGFNDTLNAVNINSKGQKAHTFDAIDIGSGMTGGWAAKELCEEGLKTLVLERGRNIEHIKDYTTAAMHPWELKYRNNLTVEMARGNPIVSPLLCF